MHVCWKLEDAALSALGALLAAGAVGFAAGWRLHAGKTGLLLADVLQSVIGGGSAVVAYLLTGPVQNGALEIVLVALIGAWSGSALPTLLLLSSVGSGRIGQSKFRDLSICEPRSVVLCTPPTKVTSDRTG